MVADAAADANGGNRPGLRQPPESSLAYAQQPGRLRWLQENGGFYPLLAFEFKHCASFYARHTEKPRFYGLVGECSGPTSQAVRVSAKPAS
jgi:hypothetical protein